MKRLGLLLTAALLLAGCSDDPPPSEDLDDPFNDQDVDLRSGKGLLRGVVVDQGIRPLEEAEVFIRPAQLTATTDVNGAFQFVDLDPGTYFITASKPGYDEVQQTVDVVANVEDPRIVRVLLEAVPGTEPSVETFSFNGFIECSAGTPATFHECGATGADQATAYFPLEGSVRWIQTEILWQSTQPTGDTMYVVQGICACSDQTSFPDFPERFNETAEATSVHLTQVGEAFIGAQLAAGADTLVVSLSSGGPANGTGLALNQEFNVYATVFSNMDPQPGWSFVEDGDHPEP
ncbi:MAG: carboxypeptidase-like regulatory domain-containing protein [Thermoplasmatota archaeon]